MGLGDRDYMRNGDSNKRKHRPRRTNGRSVVVTLIFINFALWLANGLFFNDNALTNALLLQQRLEPNAVGAIEGGGIERTAHFLDPVTCYRYLTYGFVHSYEDWMHIVFNMIALVMFGYGMMLGIGPGGIGFVRGENVEGRLGRLEFTAFYFLTIIVGGVVFALINLDAPSAGVLGASGGVCGVVILYAWLYPRKTLLFWGILPMPMWAIGMLIVLMDAMGAAGSLWGGVAYSVHLAGAACGTLYYFVFLKRGVQLTGWITAPSNRPKRPPKLRIHVPADPPPAVPPAAEGEFSRRLDEILKRYGEVGESGLTAEERDFLRQASRKFAEKSGKR